MSSGDNTDERNPFAPPPADAPDRLWQPRTPQPPAGGQSEEPDSQEPPQVPPPHPWSPGYQGGWHPQPPQQPRFDPADPAQRRARNALVSGMAALVCALGGIQSVALLTGAIAVYWAVSAMRATPKAPTDPGSPAAVHPGPAANPQNPAALGGLLTGAVAVVVVACAIGLSLYYRDFDTCVRDALTSTAEQNCGNLAPKWYVSFVTPGN